MDLNTQQPNRFNGLSQPKNGSGSQLIFNSFSINFFLFIFLSFHLSLLSLFVSSFLSVFFLFFLSSSYFVIVTIASFFIHFPTLFQIIGIFPAYHSFFCIFHCFQRFPHIFGKSMNFQNKLFSNTTLRNLSA